MGCADGTRNEWLKPSLGEIKATRTAYTSQKKKGLPLYYNVYQPNRCLTRAQDFSILVTKTAEAVRLPLNSNTK